MRSKLDAVVTDAGLGAGEDAFIGRKESEQRMTISFFPSLYWDTLEDLPVRGHTIELGLSAGTITDIARLDRGHPCPYVNQFERTNRGRHG